MVDFPAAEEALGKSLGSIPLDSGFTFLVIDTPKRGIQFEQTGAASKTLRHQTSRWATEPVDGEGDRRGQDIHCIRNRLLGRHLGLSGAELPFVQNKFGKPELPGQYGIGFNASRSGPLAALAFVRNGTVGIDIERKGIYPSNPFLAASRFFTSQEAEWVDRAVVLEEARQRFVQIWVLKEAVSKALGYGLAMDWQAIRINMDALETSGPDAISIRGFEKEIGPSWKAELIRINNNTWTAWAGSHDGLSPPDYIQIHADGTWGPLDIQEKYPVYEIARLKSIFCTRRN